MDELRCYTRHVRACGFCLLPGARDWFQRHGFDWRDFIHNGIEASKMLETGDALGARVVEAARKERDEQQF